MTGNKKTVEKYLEGFRKSDHEQVLSCLTDGIVWEIPGAFHLVGKDAFDKEIENDAFVGSPTITTTAGAVTDRFPARRAGCAGFAGR